MPHNYEKENAILIPTQTCPPIDKKDDDYEPDLQWLETSINLVLFLIGSIAVGICRAIIVSVGIVWENWQCRQK